LDFPHAQLRDQAFGGDIAKRFIDDIGYFIPIDFVLARQVQVDSEPTRKCASGRRGRFIEPRLLSADHDVLKVPWDRTPNRHAPIASMIVVEVAKWQLIQHEKAQHTMAQAFRDVRQSKYDFS
jgi:hypothetical protein